MPRRVWRAGKKSSGYSRLFAALRTLGIPQRQVLTLALEGMDLAEVGACLGISAATAAVRLSRARSALRERLREPIVTKQTGEGS